MRIRSIKPDFWRSPDISCLTIEDRLLFIGLWSYVDDNGVGQDRESLVAADLFADDLSRHPRDTLARVADGLQRLASAGRINRYTVDGRGYLSIDNWEKHQRIDRPNKPRYPLPTSENAQMRDTLATPSRHPRENPLPGTGDKSNRGTEERNISSEASSDSSAQRPDARPNAYPPAFEDWWTTYPRRRNASKKDAAKQWREATKSIDPEELLRLTAAYADNPGVDDARYIPHPHKWLKDRRWESIDETNNHVAPQPARQGVTADALLASFYGEDMPSEPLQIGGNPQWQLGA